MQQSIPWGLRGNIPLNRFKYLQEELEYLRLKAQALEEELEELQLKGLVSNIFTKESESESRRLQAAKEDNFQLRQQLASRMQFVEALQKLEL